MSNRLADLKLLQHDVESVDTALTAYEEGMFKPYDHSGGKEAVSDGTPENLRYLFGIFR
jgi:hypothetical protein